MYYRTSFVISELEKIRNKLTIENPNEEFTEDIESDRYFNKIIDSLIKISVEANKFKKIVDSIEEDLDEEVIKLTEDLELDKKLGLTGVKRYLKKC